MPARTAGRVGQSARAATVPVVTGVSPDTGAAVGSTSVTITGSGFTGATAVDFGPVPVYGSIPADSFTVVSDTEITATFSQNGDFVGTTDVTVTTPDGTSATSAADQITFVLPPTLTSVSPDNGPIAGGNAVTITGTGFTDASAVTFGSIPATSCTVVSDTEITAIAPAVALTETYPSGLPYNMLDVTVTTPNGSADVIGAQFNYVQTPAITGVSPQAGPTAGGNTVTITGTCFKFSRALDVVGLEFGSTPVTNYTVNSATQITATVPPGRGGHGRHHHDCHRRRRCPDFGG
ncbi:MAG: IPT/TIG domain-containing protein [Trebonia sp.]